MVRHYAHSCRKGPPSEWHGLADHLEDTADRAAKIAAKWGGSEWARAAAILHDLGKYSRAFQARLRGNPTPVDHSTAGAQLAAKLYGPAGTLIAHGIAGHHGGMPDGSGADDACLRQRLTRPVEAHDDYADEIVPPAELPTPLLREHPTQRAKRTGWELHHWGRMTFSALCDADFIDTETYYGGQARGSAHSLNAIARRLDQHMASVAAKAPATPINAIRAEVLAAVRARVRDKRGLFSLTVPTGGGKTLASLVWALGHARAHGLDRVIYVAPFTSIIDQTAAVFRGALGDLGDAVLEHHTSYRDTGAAEAADKVRRDSENWDAPIIVTTAVQFFESLHSNRPSRCRKLHNIARAVVILDEAQTMPANLLMPCVAMIDTMSRNYGCSIMLCTATQPAIRERPDDPKRSLVGGLNGVRELIPAGMGLHDRLRRVRVEHGGKMDDAALVSELGAVDQGLVIVNTRRHACDLYSTAVGAGLTGLAHLSALMCPAHRGERLREIRDALKSGEPVRLISTTVIEAGVDVDFARVWRAITGLDSITQSAGRCNREGKRPLADSLVTVFDPADPRMIPHHVRTAVNATRQVIERHRADLIAPEAVEAYFASYYWRRGFAAGGLDKADIMTIVEEHRSEMLYPYATIAEQFRLVDEDGGVAIIIPYDDEAQTLLAELRTAENPLVIARQLQRYTVQIPDKVMAELLASGQAAVVLDDEESPYVELIDQLLYLDTVGLNVL